MAYIHLKYKNKTKILIHSLFYAQNVQSCKKQPIQFYPLGVDKEHIDLCRKLSAATWKTSIDLWRCCFFSIAFVPQIQFHKARAFPGTEAAGKGRTAKTPIVCYHSTFRLEQFSHQTNPGVSCYHAGVCECLEGFQICFPQTLLIDRLSASQPGLC